MKACHFFVALFGLFICNSAITAIAQYKDPLAFELKGPVKSCQVYVNGNLDDSYTFDTNGFWLTQKGENVSKIFKEIRHDIDHKLIYAREYESSSGEPSFVHQWLYNSSEQMTDYSTYCGEITDKNLFIEFSYSDFNAMGCYTQRESQLRVKVGFDNFEYDSHGNWIKRRMLDVNGKPWNTMTRTITYYSDGYSSSKPSASSTFEAPQHEVQATPTATPKAEFISTHVSRSENKADLDITTDVIVTGANGKQIQFVAFFDGEKQGVPLKDTNNLYASTEGNVCTTKTFTVASDTHELSNLPLGIPLSELHLTNGQHTVNMRIFAFCDGKIIGNGPFRTITLLQFGKEALFFNVTGE